MRLGSRIGRPRGPGTLAITGSGGSTFGISCGRKSKASDHEKGRANLAAWRTTERAARVAIASRVFFGNCGETGGGETGGGMSSKTRINKGRGARAGDVSNRDSNRGDDGGLRVIRK